MSDIPVFSWILFAPGLVLLAAGVVSTMMARAFVAKAARVEATVVVTEQVLKSPDGTPSAHKAKVWVAEFQDRKGLRQQLQLGVAMDVKLGSLQLGDPEEAKSLPAAGSRISVLFDPENPLQVRRDSFAELWRMPVFLMAGGAVALCLGLFAMLLTS